MQEASWWCGYWSINSLVHVIDRRGHQVTESLLHSTEDSWLTVIVLSCTESTWPWCSHSLSFCSTCNKTSHLNLCKIANMKQIIVQHQTQSLGALQNMFSLYWWGNTKRTQQEQKISLLFLLFFLSRGIVGLLWFGLLWKSADARHLPPDQSLTDWSVEGSD